VTDFRLDPLLVAAYEDPTSDEKRAVYADALVERGEPLGELIHLQLRKKRGSIKRMKEIFDPTWWNALHPVGAIAGALEVEVIERGFPSLMRVGIHRDDEKNDEVIGRWRAQVGHPGWATVERMWTYSDHPVVGEILSGSPFPILREVTSIGPKVLGAIARTKLPVHSLQVYLPPAGKLPVVKGLPSLRSLTVGVDAETATGIEQARALGVLDRIEELVVWGKDDFQGSLDATTALPKNVTRFATADLVVTREPALELSMSTWEVEEAAALLEALPAKRFARVRVEFSKHGSFRKKDRPRLAARIRAATKHLKGCELVLGD
jgi:uncharacterized protein (TIGR02996 family)